MTTKEVDAAYGKLTGVAMEEASLEQARLIAAEIAAIAASGRVLPGSIVERRTRCGKTNCACHGDEPKLHGPYYQWTRKVAAKTVGSWMTKQDSDEYQGWVENSHKLRELVSRLEALGVAAFESRPSLRDDKQRPGD